MANREYAELLKDPRWQRRRLEILNRDGWRCCQCEDAEKTLHVHHRYYDGRKPWDYEPEALMTLCVDCHALATTHTKLLKLALRKVSPADLMRIVGYVEGIVAARDVVNLVVSDAQFAEGMADCLGVLDDELIDAAVASNDRTIDVTYFEIEGVERRNELRRKLRS